jgi:hypothetical protein
MVSLYKIVHSFRVHKRRKVNQGYLGKVLYVKRTNLLMPLVLHYRGCEDIQQHAYHAIEKGNGIEVSVKIASLCDNCNGRLVLPKITEKSQCVSTS